MEYRLAYRPIASHSDVFAKMLAGGGGEEDCMRKSERIRTIVDQKLYYY